MTRLALCFVLLALVAFPAFAQEEKKLPDASSSYAAPKKESLIAFWEQNLKSDPHVQLFEKEKEEGAYTFHTDFFPYRGKLKLLNAAVSEYDGQYYQNLYRGIIEVELPDADEAFYKKYARSYGAWTQDLNFYYNAKKGAWFTAEDWDANVADFDKYTAATSLSPGCSPAVNFWNRYGSTIISFCALFALIGLLLVFAKRQNKRIWDNHAKALEEQQRGLKMVEESQKIAQESLKHQQEHTRLLQEMLAALRK